MENKMYRILIVDDEKIERRGILFLLKKIGIEMEVREAQNGQEALEILESYDAHILFTDVKMPFMDGLTLLSHIMPKRPNLKSVVFSGFSEFEYARTALRLGVKNYILKPVDPKEFEETIIEIIEELNKEKIIQERKEKEEDFRREHILSSLLNGISMETLKEKVKNEENFKFLNHIKRLFFVEFTNEFFNKIVVNFQEVLEENLSFDFYYLNLSQSQCLILQKNGLELEVEEIGKMIWDRIRENFGVKSYIAISDKIERMEEIVIEFEKLELLMEQKFYEPKQYIFTKQEKLIGYGGTEQIDDDVLMKQMKQDLQMKDIERLKEHFQMLCEKYRGKKDFSQVYIKFIFSSLLKDIYGVLPSEREVTFQKDIDSLYRADKFQNVMQIIDSTIYYLEETFYNIKEKSHEEIDTIIHYIEHHYGEELGVDTLANVVHITPSYLSYLFKKETGKNLCKYIKAYRMEIAKDKLEHTTGKIVDIACAVGYPNVSYFCSSFREYFGISPQKYRERLIKN